MPRPSGTRRRKRPLQEMLSRESQAFLMMKVNPFKRMREDETTHLVPKKVAKLFNEI